MATTRKPQPKTRREKVAERARLDPGPEGEVARDLLDGITEDQRPGRPFGDYYKGRQKRRPPRLGSGESVTVERGPSIRTRRDWANDPEHVESAPDHVLTCPVCNRPFDSHVDPATGEHHQRRPASYCSPTCQDTAAKRRHRAKAKGVDVMPTADEDALGDLLARRPETAEESRVREVIAKVANGFNAGRYWTPLTGQEWLTLQRGAPAVASGLRYYENQTVARKRAEVGLRRIGFDRAEQLRHELQDAILEWLINHPGRIAPPAA